MALYRATSYTPFLVDQATALADQMGFAHSSCVEVGRLLHVLVRQYQRGTIGEIGTGCGVGAAWIISALAPVTGFVTVELDPGCARAAQALFAPFPKVRVIRGDWHDILPYGPFVLLFADGGQAKQTEPDVLLHALEPGGLLVLDDLTPREHWPPNWRSRPDPVRDYWLNDPRVAATEIRVTPTSAVILAARIG
jgi:predicted O-methyltransferase YrrM